MAKITEEAQEMIERFSPALVATAGRDGRPNVSPKGSFRVLDEEHVVFADIASLRTMANLRENPKIAAMVFDPSSRRGCRIWGEAEILDSGDLFESIKAEYGARKMKVKHVVRVRVEEIITF